MGCGQGGGASYLARTLRPASYVGLDLNAAGIEFCRRRHQVPALEFTQGHAENLPFRSESFDVVINVESSHFYPHFDRFLSEVATEVLRGMELNKSQWVHTTVRAIRLENVTVGMLIDVDLKSRSFGQAADNTGPSEQSPSTILQPRPIQGDAITNHSYSVIEVEGTQPNGIDATIRNGLA